MKKEYSEWYHINYKKIDQIILLLERKEYEFCKLTFSYFYFKTYEMKKLTGNVWIRRG
jgi:hypothetical protein